MPRWTVVVTLALVGSASAVAAAMVGVKSAATRRLDRVWDVAVDPVPMPLTQAEIQAATTRGEHLVQTRLGCLDCHGADGAGAVIVDDPAMGRWVAPHITQGGIGADLSNADWVRAIRHGITSDRTTSTMPSIDYQFLSDRDVADVITYIEGLPPSRVDPPRDQLGPLRALLYLTGGIPLSAEHIDHSAHHPAEPPAEIVSVEFGRHVAMACVGCHGTDFAGGRIKGGDPSWPPASNLTPHPQALGGWSVDDLATALREGRRPGGSTLDAPMPWRATAGMTDTEIGALHAYFQSLPPVPNRR